MVFPWILHWMVVVVVYHVTIVAIGHGLLKKFWPLVKNIQYTPEARISVESD